MVEYNEELDVTMPTYVLISEAVTALAYPIC